MATAEVLIYEKADGVARIRLNRPERLNALNQEMRSRLIEALDDIRDDRGVRAVVITGTGRGFCGGGDISGEKGAGEVFDETDIETVRRHISTSAASVPMRIRQLNVPTIAMVNGLAVGFGFELALSCDLRIASENARFMVAFTRIGSVPPLGGVWILLRTIGLARTAQLVYTGDFLEAKQAEVWGLVNKVTRPEDLEAETMALARRLASGPSVALGLDKLLMYKSMEINLDSAIQLGASLNAIAHTTQDKREGVAAFREKRKAIFRGK